MLVYIALRSKVLKNRADDEYYAPMIFRLTHEIIITFEHYLISRSKDLEIRRNPEYLELKIRLYKTIILPLRENQEEKKINKCSIYCKNNHSLSMHLFQV